MWLLSVTLVEALERKLVMLWHGMGIMCMLRFVYAQVMHRYGMI